MSCRASSGAVVDYSSSRVDRRAPPAELRARYRPIGPVFHARERTLDHFLTARSCLYAADARGRLFRGEIDHAPWPLQRAEATIEQNTMLESHGLHAPSGSPLLHFARRLDVAAWPLAPVD
jgi:uncharacterized protein YqjF (DUF2071 family)